MTYIVNDKCIKCKEMDCVEVCPVDCFYEGENFLAIKPDECIDCGVCEPECPVDAIEPDTNKGTEEWVKINTKYSEIWPNITKKRAEDVPKDHKEWRSVVGKLKYLSEKPGKGD
jgi:ferredoxin